ncbi:MAG: site-specific integrase [Candidatus Acidiferrum sp.]
MLLAELKGHARGTRMTAAGLRSLFRYHRQATGIQIANPHRLRNTFASDMIRAGMSLPALMQLMGHTNIQTTLLYVLVTPQDVYLEYARVEILAVVVFPADEATCSRGMTKLHSQMDTRKLTQSKPNEERMRIRATDGMRIWKVANFVPGSPPYCVNRRELASQRLRISAATLCATS